MSYSKEQIEKWIATSTQVVNERISSNNLIRLLLESKFQIDQWNYIPTDFIIHSSLKDFLKEELANNRYFPNYSGTPHIWGMRINFVNNIPIDIGLSVADILPELNNKQLSSFKFDVEMIKRYQDLKSFW